MPDRPPITRAVLLRHDLPDGSAHFDWLIERPDDPAEHRCITFRIAIDDAGPRDQAPFEALHLPDHRAHYLTHEGPVSGGRGTVRRIAAWDAALLTDSPDHITVLLRGGAETAAWAGHPTENNVPEPLWRFAPASPSISDVKIW